MNHITKEYTLILVVTGSNIDEAHLDKTVKAAVLHSTAHEAIDTGIEGAGYDDFSTALYLHINP